MHEKLKEFLLNFGFSKTNIKKILEMTSTRGVTLIKAKIQDYKNLFNLSDSEIKNMIVKFPALLGFDTISESEASVKGKVKTYKNLFKLSDSEIRKMIVKFPIVLCLDTISKNETSVRGKIKAYKNLLNLSDSEMRKMIVASPSLLGYDTNSDSETSVRGKIRAYKNLLNLSDNEVRKMIVSYPQLFGLDTFSDIKTSVKCKIDKIQQVIPFEKFREIAIEQPTILTAPAQSFKIRYMLANVIGNVPEFFKRGFMTNERKVWSRFCYLQSINNKSKSYILLGEQSFVKYFGITSEELMEKYPLDEKAVKKVEKAYFEKTGEKMTLDKNERQQLGFER